ncbi:MAG: hypothetical protein ACRD2I_03350 [Vicinamibacterales bacterium]
MAFLRFTRDKRGVENFYLVQPTTDRRGKVRPRVLYWFRSPPEVKVGREPFDPGVRRALELQHPNVDFDWRAIVETPIPSADADRWRERRRAERAARHAAAEEESVAAGDGGSPDPFAAASELETVAAETALATPATLNTQRASGAPRGEANRKRRRRRRQQGGRENGAARLAISSRTEPAGD